MLHIVMLALMPVPPLFASANALRMLCVRGSRPRFLLATVCRATLGPALAEPVLSGADVLAHGIPVGLPLAAVLLVLVLYVARLFLDDDDDWFTRAGRRLKRWAKTTIRRWQARPAPAPGRV